MKRIIIFILLFATLSSCAKQKKKDYMIFSGKIQKTTEKSFIIQGDPNMGSTVGKRITINEDGIFSDTLKIVKPEICTLMIGEEYIEIYFSKGNNLELSLDLEKLKNTKYKGVNGNDNNYLFSKLFGINEFPIIDYNTLYSFPENEFLEIINTYTKQIKAKTNIADLSNSFLKRELKNIRYSHLVRLGNYEVAHREDINDKSFKVSDSFPQEESNFDYNNLSEYQNNREYSYLLYIYIGRAWEKTVMKNKDITYLDIINEKVSNITIKNHLLFSIFTQSFTTSTNKQAYYNSFIKYSTNEENNNKAKKMYTEMLALDRGNPAPKFVNLENYKGGTTSLDDFKGKYVYIDVWATW